VAGLYLYTMNKLGIILFVSPCLAAILTFVNKYIFNDWEYAIFLVIAIAIDTLLGFYKHFKRGTVSSSAWGKILSKIISYGSILTIIHILSHFTVDCEQVKIFAWIETIAYSALMVKEGISILENVGTINEKWVPTWLLKKLKEFDETGKFTTDENNS